MVTVRTERVPYARHVAAAAVDQRDVTLVDRSVADVAARRDDHIAAADVQRAPDLFARRIPGDARFPNLVSAGYRQLVNEAIGGCGVHVAAVGIEYGRGRGDLVTALQVPDRSGRVLPQAGAGGRVERDCAPVRGGDEVDVTNVSMRLDPVHLHRRGIGDPVYVHDARLEAAEVAPGDAGVARSNPAALGVVVEGRPVAIGDLCCLCQLARRDSRDRPTLGAARRQERARGQQRARHEHPRASGAGGPRQAHKPGRPGSLGKPGRSLWTVFVTCLTVWVTVWVTVLTGAGTLLVTGESGFAGLEGDEGLLGLVEGEGPEGPLGEGVDVDGDPGLLPVGWLELVG